MDEFDSANQLVYNGTEFHWVQVVLYQGAPHIKIDGALFDIYGYQKFRRAKERPFSRLELIPNGGRLVVVTGEWFEEAEVNQQGGPALGATNTAATELSSGPLGVAAGANPTRIILANPNRIRGVSVQNVGAVAVAVSRDPGLLQGGIVKAEYILNAGAAANDGNGGSVVFDGWQGEVWAVNVAGGPGSVLVGAF